MKQKLTVGIIGCGEITSNVRAHAFDAAGTVKIGMVMDVVEWAAKDLGQRYNVPYTTKLEDMLANRDIDFVYISTPHHLHAPIAIASAKAGKHVLVEKPMAVNLAEADAMISACQENGVTLSTYFPLRYMPGVMRAKELVDEGVIGNIIGTRITTVGIKPSDYWQGGYSGRIKSDWRTLKEKSGGGILIMNSVHYIDAMRYVTGLEAKSVYSQYDTFLTEVEVEDFAAVTLRYTNGAIGIIEASSCVDSGPDSGAVQGDRVYGSEGQLVTSSPLWLRTRRDTEFGEANKWLRIETGPEGNPALDFVTNFAEALIAGKSPPVTGDDGRKALEIIVAAYESGLKKAPIELPI